MRNRFPAAFAIGIGLVAHVAQAGVICFHHAIPNKWIRRPGKRGHCQRSLPAIGPRLEKSDRPLMREGSATDYQRDQCQAGDRGALPAPVLGP